jgi:hypothetical protein
MEQCTALTKTKERCKRPPAEQCAGLCRQHFEALPSSRRKLALKWALRVGGYGISVAQWIVLMDKLWDVIGKIIGVSSTSKELAQLRSNDPKVATKQAYAVFARATPKPSALKRIAMKSSFRPKSGPK